MRHVAPLALATITVLSLAGCGPSYSPDTYASTAVQQANKVESGVIVGVRQVQVSASGTVGAAAGAGAGGILGAQTPGGGVATAFGTIGGALVGGLAGTAAEHATADTTAYEYIVRKPNGDLVSVTQKDQVPLALGEKVLVIAGNQARVVPDYTVTVAPPTPPTPPAHSPAPAAAAGATSAPAEPASATPPAVSAGATPVPVTATPLTPPPPTPPPPTPAPTTAVPATTSATTSGPVQLAPAPVVTPPPTPATTSAATTQTSAVPRTGDAAAKPE